MSKFMKPEDREKNIKELMSSIRNSTQGSRCIDVFEDLLNTINDKHVVDTAVVDMSRFVSEFSRLSKNVDNINGIDYISKMLSFEFIQPGRFFNASRKNGQMYVDLHQFIKGNYPDDLTNEGKRKLVLSNKNNLGDLVYRDITNENLLVLTGYFNLKLDRLKTKDIKDCMDESRKVALLYNIMPAIVKAFIQTKRRSFNLDKNSTKF